MSHAMPALTAEQATFLRDRWLIEFELEDKHTRNVIGACPDDKLTWSPHEKSMAFGKLAAHLYTTGDWFARIIEAGGTDKMGDSDESIPDPPPTTAALLDQCGQWQAGILERFRACTPEQLTATANFFDMMQPQAVDYLDWYRCHMIHHRGQMVVYLRCMGAKVPSTYGPSGDAQYTVPT